MWHTVGRVAHGQDLQTRLEDMTHEQRKNFPQYHDDIDRAKEAAKILAPLFESQLPYEIDLSGYRLPDGKHIIHVQIMTTVM